MEGLYNTGFIKDEKNVVCGDIRFAMKRAEKISRIKQLQKELTEEKIAEKEKKILGKDQSKSELLPMKRKAAPDSEKSNSKKQKSLLFFGFKPKT